MRFRENRFPALRYVDSKFSDYNKRSLAFDVVELLEWRTIDRFIADLASLA